MLKCRIHPNDPFEISFGPIYIFWEDTPTSIRRELHRKIETKASEPYEHKDELEERECDSQILADLAIKWLHVSADNRKKILHWYMEEIKEHFEVNGDPLLTQETD